MDPDEPIAPWFDAAFEQWSHERSAALRRRLGSTRLRLAALIEDDQPGATLTPDLFIDCASMLVLEANLPRSTSAARAHVGTVARLVEVAAAAGGGPDVLEHARQEVLAARAGVQARAEQRPDDPWARRIPRRLLHDH
ncbi:hypothetical protein [Aeromicrobium sp. CF3.5]|uniref:hypothetical protein n=1 Tax=Aeromicrobium sp. CF3.5 TaxID=3373078 RepID=UPI003EE4402A